MSGRPSLLKSPIPTPPPLYMLTISSGLMESLSVIWLLKWIPEWDEEICSNKVCLLLQATRYNAVNQISNMRNRFIKYVLKLNYSINVAREGCNKRRLCIRYKAFDKIIVEILITRILYQC